MSPRQVIAVQFGLGVIFVLAIGSMLVGVSIAAVVAEVGFFAAIKYCILISACGVGFFLTTGTTFDIISATIQVMLCGIFFCYWTITKCQKDLPFLYSITIALSAALGTNFRGADLTNADFTKATLKSTNFAGANLTHTCWRNIKNLDRVHPGNTYLQNAKLRNLLITGEGRKEIFDRCQDLRGVNLRKAKLENISFIKTDLCEANLQEATLTGACIEDWNINSETNLEGVICDYVYLKEGKQERRPHDPNKNFAPEEFTKLFQKALETVDLIFREGVDWKAFAYSFQNLQVVNQDTPLAIQSIESKGDGVVLIRVSVSKNADKTKIEGDFWQGYEFARKALETQYQARIDDKDKEINRLFLLLNQAQEKLGEVPKLMAEQPKVQQNFSGSVYGVAGNVEGNQNIYTPEQKQTLAEAAEEIQRLLKQLEQTNPTATLEQQQAFVDAAVSPTLKARFLSALQAGWKEAVKEFLDNPYVNVGVAILEGWQEAE